MDAKIIFSVLIVTTSIYTNTQANSVWFSNIAGNSVCSQVFDTDQVTLLTGERYRAQLWYREAGTEGPLVPFPETFGFFSEGNGGFFGTPSFYLPDIPFLGQIDAQARIWDSESGSSWETAQRRWKSNIVRYQTSDGVLPPHPMTGLEFTFLQIHHIDNSFSFTWPNQEICGKTYQLESAENIVGPWIPVEELAELVDGRWQVTLDDLNPSQRYFRLRLLESNPDTQMLLALIEQLGIAPELFDEAMAVISNPQ